MSPLYAHPCLSMKVYLLSKFCSASSPRSRMNRSGVPTTRRRQIPSMMTFSSDTTSVNGTARRRLQPCLRFSSQFSMRTALRIFIGYFWMCKAKRQVHTLRVSKKNEHVLPNISATSSQKHMYIRKLCRDTEMCAGQRHILVVD